MSYNLFCFITFSFDKAFEFPNFISDMLNKARQSDRAPPAVGAYPHARQVGQFLFLSGVGPRKKSQKTIPGVELDSDNNIKSYDI